MPNSNEDMLTLMVAYSATIIEKPTNGSFLLRHYHWPHQSVRLTTLCLERPREEHKR